MNTDRGDGIFHSDGGYLDDPISTEKTCISTNTIPPGWREYTGLQGRFPVGYVSGDPDFGSLTGAGGAKTHTHGTTLGSAIGMGSVALAYANHLPPRIVKFIERYCAPEEAGLSP